MEKSGICYDIGYHRDLFCGVNHLISSLISINSHNKRKTIVIPLPHLARPTVTIKTFHFINSTVSFYSFQSFVFAQPIKPGSLHFGVVELVYLYWMSESYFLATDPRSDLPVCLYSFPPPLHSLLLLYTNERFQVILYFG